MKHIFIFLIFFLFTNILFAGELVVDCKKGKWKGSWLTTPNNKVKADGDNSGEFERTTYYIETPIVVGGSPVIVVYDGALAEPATWPVPKVCGANTTCVSRKISASTP